MTSLQAVIDYYDQTRFDYRVAWLPDENPAVHFGLYDEQATNHAAALLNTNRILADLAGIQPGSLVLDAGCGQGASCFWLYRERQAVPTGISPVPSQIADCRKHARHFCLEKNTHFVEADYCQSGLADNHFDVVWACESVCHAPEKEKFYREAYRVLKPGGRLVMAEYIRRERPLDRAREQGLLSWLHCWAIPDLDTTSEHRRHAMEAGFSSFRIQDATKKARVSLHNLHRQSKRWIGLGHLLYGLGIRSRVQHDNHLGSLRLFPALEQDAWFYGLILAEKPFPEK